jgi:Domain of unknown function (DUF4279)
VRQFGISKPRDSEDSLVLTTHYAYFGLWSRRMPASEMAALLKFEPDEISVRGTELIDPVVPAWHEWRIACRDPDVDAGEQINRIVRRLTPSTAAIGRLVEQLRRDDCGGARLRVVRHIDHPLSSWHLDCDVVRFLELTRADLDVEEHRPVALAV